MPVGGGYVLTVPPKKLELPNNNEKKPVAPKVAAGSRAADQQRLVVVAHLGERHSRTSISDPMYPHPLPMTRTPGTVIGYPTEPR